ncbi:MAG: phosphoenolpyruvate carboxykinase (GTP) [Phycisphaerae bacterium]
MVLQHSGLQSWIDEVASLTRPDQILVCDGSQSEFERFKQQALTQKIFYSLDETKWPGCLYHRSHPKDVARTEGRTFICTREKKDAGITNNWMAPDQAKETVLPLFKNSMTGRTMYVLPYLMGPVGSPYSNVGVELTDSLYVAISMRIMTRMGQVALDALGSDGKYVKGLHSMGDLEPDHKYILHFPEEHAIWSVGSGYGGNALLGKKCHSLRIASWQARNEGWMAEHMLILGLETPDGEITYMAAAFPSACGKTNLAMLASPLEKLGYRVWMVGDDIAWLNIGPDGRLWAMNPENGFFGVAPGTSAKTNPNALKTVAKNSLFTNVVLGKDGSVWWEGMDVPPPAEGWDWLGNPWTSASPEKGAHPNSRFTTPVAQCPTLSKRWQDPQGVPISAIIFGGRRARLAPLVYQSFDWNHGTYVGATMASEQTAASEGKIGIVRRDPMAMLPFCGYNMTHYFRHWFEMGQKIKNPPMIFHINWFRTNEKGKFLWPGFGENIRVLIWIAERIKGKGKAVKAPIGHIPTPDGLLLDGLDISKENLDQLLAVNQEDWQKELKEHQEFLATFGEDLPKQLTDEYNKLHQRLG